MLVRISALDGAWLPTALAALDFQGCVIVTDVLSTVLLERLRAGLYNARQGILEEIGIERLHRAGEIGTIRIPFRFDDAFFELLRLPAVLDVVDATVGPAAILHLQNGFVLPSFGADATPAVFQNNFHRDFPRYLNGYLASINTFFAIDDFSVANGATLVVPGSHQRADVPPQEYIDSQAVAVEAPAGSMLIFDSTLWHAAGKNFSGKDRLAINQQFTRSYIKQQIDYVRALGDEAIARLPERSQQLLGWYTRVVTSLDEYYRPAEERLYRGGQG